MLGTTIVSTLVVVMIASNDWVTSILTSCLHVLTTIVFELLVKLCWLEFDNVPFCGYPLVFSMVQNMDVNTLLIFYSSTEWMDESVNSIIPIDFPTPCLLICSRLQEFLVPFLVVDPLMFLPHSIIPHVYQYLLWCKKA